jgi:tetrahydromethanopterin S-methyltransferase subunit G
MAVPHFERKVLAQLIAIRNEQAKQAKRLETLETGVLNLSAELALSHVGPEPEDRFKNIRARLDGLEERIFER